jgi:hypothetical protein
MKCPWRYASLRSEDTERERLPVACREGQGSMPHARRRKRFGRPPRRSQRQLQAGAIDARERRGPEGRRGGDGRDQGSASSGPGQALAGAEPRCLPPPRRLPISGSCGAFPPASGGPPGYIEPCIPTRVSKPPVGPEWVNEIKHDGYRLNRKGATTEVTAPSGTKAYKIQKVEWR